MHFTEKKAEAREVEQLTPSHTAHAAQRQSWSPRLPHSRCCCLSWSLGCRAQLPDAVRSCSTHRASQYRWMQQRRTAGPHHPAVHLDEWLHSHPKVVRAALTQPRCHRKVFSSQVAAAQPPPTPGQETEEEGVLLGNRVMDTLAGRGRSPWAKVQWARAGRGPSAVLCS